MIVNFSNKKELKNYTLYSLGLLVSQLGSVLYTFVMSLHVLKITESGMFFAINLAISMIPVIFIMPFAGVLADKGNKKFNVILMDVLSGLLLISLYLYISANELSMVLIYLTTLLLSSFASLFDVSLGAAKVNIVGEEKLILINSTSDIISAVTRIVGPLLGGMLFVIIDVKIFILANGISFLLSGISELFIDFKYNEHEFIPEDTNFIEDMKNGYNYVFKRVDLKNLIGIFIVINVAFSLSVIVPLPYIVNNVLKLGSRNYGVIQAGFPVGMIAGALLAPKIMKCFSYQNVFKYSLIFLSIIIGVFSLALFVDADSVTNNFYVIYYTGTIFVTGLLVSCIDIPIITYLQTKTEKSYLGRVMAIVISSVKIATPIAYIVSGYLLDVVNVKVVSMLGFILTFVYFIIINRKNVSYQEDKT